MDKNTDELMNKLRSAEEINDLDSFLHDDLSDTEDFKTYIKNVMEEKNITPPELQKKSRIDRTYLYQILDGRRNPGRDKVIMLSIGTGLDLKNVQRALKTAGCSILYPKNRRDSILIFGIDSGESVAGINLLLERYGEAPLK